MFSKRCMIGFIVMVLLGFTSYVLLRDFRVVRVVVELVYEMKVNSRAVDVGVRGGWAQSYSLNVNMRKYLNMSESDKVRAMWYFNKIDWFCDDEILSKQIGLLARIAKSYNQLYLDGGKLIAICRISDRP